MQQEVSDRVGAYDSTVSGDATKLKRWINMAVQDITARYNWPFMIYHEIIQTVTDTTTGTIAINSGSTALTFSSAPSVSVTDYFIKFSGDNNWYRVSSHTAASTSATISPAYGGTSNLSATSYTLRKLFYATSTPLDSILDIKSTVNGRMIDPVSPREADVFLPLYWDSGQVYAYLASIPDSTGGIRISFLHSPATVENLQVRGIKKLVDMSGDTDTPFIPVRWHSGILDLASFYAFSSLDDTRSTDFYNRAEVLIQSMTQVYSADLGRHRIMRPVDSGYIDGPVYTLPTQYGVQG